jgi:hypothetical protein
MFILSGHNTPTKFSLNGNNEFVALHHECIVNSIFFLCGSVKKRRSFCVNTADQVDTLQAPLFRKLVKNEGGLHSASIGN